VHHADDVRVRGGQPVRDLRCPVPGAVVDGDDLEALGERRQGVFSASSTRPSRLASSLCAGKK